MRRDVLLAGEVESPLGIDDEPLMDIAVGAANMDVGARVVGDETGVVAAPCAGEILGRLETGGLARVDRERRYRKYQRCLVQHECSSLPIYPTATSLRHHDPPPSAGPGAATASTGPRRLRHPGRQR